MVRGWTNRLDLVVGLIASSYVVQKHIVFMACTDCNAGVDLSELG